MACRACTPARKKVLDCYITVCCADIASYRSCLPLTNPHCILPNWTSLIFLLTLSSFFSYHCPLTFNIRSSPSPLSIISVNELVEAFAELYERSDVHFSTPYDASTALYSMQGRSLFSPYLSVFLFF